MSQNCIFTVKGWCGPVGKFPWLVTMTGRKEQSAMQVKQAAFLDTVHFQGSRPGIYLLNWTVFLLCFPHGGYYGFCLRLYVGLGHNSRALLHLIRGLHGDYTKMRQAGAGCRLFEGLCYRQQISLRHSQLTHSHPICLSPRALLIPSFFGAATFCTCLTCV